MEKLEDIEKKIAIMTNKNFSKLLRCPQGVLGEKIRELALARMKNKKSHKFEKKLDIVNGGIEVGQKHFSEKSSYHDYRKTDKQTWNYITGAGHWDEYFSYGNNYFIYYPELFHIGFELYVANVDSGFRVAEKFPSCKNDYERMKREYGGLLDFFEIDADSFYERRDNALEELSFEYSEGEMEEFGLDMEPSLWSIYKLCWYVALAIEHELSPSIVETFPYEEAETLMRSIYCDLGIGEVGLMEYVRYFIDFLADHFELQDDSMKKDLLPVLERAYFGCISPDAGVTMHAYLFASVNIKKYEDLRKLYPNSKYVPLLDKLLYELKDPLKFEELSIGTSLVYGEREVYQKHFYTQEEYVCCYLFFPVSLYGGETADCAEDVEPHYFHPLLLEMRSQFDELLSLYEKECKRKERKKVS